MSAEDARRAGGLLVVRATVREDLRDSFDRWYQREHLPQAHAAFQAGAARRGWSVTEPGQHWAIYEFAELESATALPGSDRMQRFIEEFDAAWPVGVERTREILDVVQSI